MSEASSLSISVTAESHGRRSKVKRMLTLEMIIGWIESQGFDEFTTKGLIELASRYPNNALPLFKKNFNLMLQRVRAKRQKEGEVQDERATTQIKEDKQEDRFVSFEDALNAGWGQKGAGSAKAPEDKLEVEEAADIEEAEIAEDAFDDWRASEDN